MAGTRSGSPTRRPSWARNAVGVAVDNADAEAPERPIAAARENFGGFHGMLVSVGARRPGPSPTTPHEQWRGWSESVFLGAVRLRPAAAAELAEGGVIGLVLSGSGTSRSRGRDQCQRA